MIIFLPFKKNKKNKIWTWFCAFFLFTPLRSDAHKQMNTSIISINPVILQRLKITGESIVNEEHHKDQEPDQTGGEVKSRVQL